MFLCLPEGYFLFIWNVISSIYLTKSYIFIQFCHFDDVIFPLFQRFVTSSTQLRLIQTSLWTHALSNKPER